MAKNTNFSVNSISSEIYLFTYLIVQALHKNWGLIRQLAGPMNQKQALTVNHVSLLCVFVIILIVDKRSRDTQIAKKYSAIDNVSYEF